MSQFEARKTSFSHERALLDEIRKNPDLHHNALINLMVPKYMAKTTFEKTKNRLLEKNVLFANQKGNKKIYQISENYPKKSQQLLERITHENYQYLQQEVRRAKEKFHHMDVNEKITRSVQLLRGLLKTDNGFTILDSAKNAKKTLYKEEHQMIQEMISKIFEIILNDQESELIYPIVNNDFGLDIPINFEESE